MSLDRLDIRNFRFCLRVPKERWKVIEEPEMGLHPQAVTAVMLGLGDRGSSRPIP